MSQVHGKDTELSFWNLSEGPSGYVDLTDYCDNSSFPQPADNHDLTTYGKNSHVYRGGLKNFTFSCGGVYDNGASNTPRTIFNNKSGDLFSIRRRAEGTGSGKPQEIFNAVLTNFTPTNPVADYIRWTAEFQVSDDIDDTDQ